MAVPVRGNPTRKDTWRTQVNIDGIDYGIWDIKTGGEVDSDQQAPYKPGGMGDPIALGGSSSTGNVTLSRICILEDDWQTMAALVQLVGKAKVKVAQTGMDINGDVFAGKATLTYLGKLKRVTPPEVDSNSTDAAMVEIEVVCDGKPF